ncbi:hypothetical protein CEXT_617641 [Caerostris extrusa]|uniref:Uncharacterized protein n=1 Tax=Caerostris extrusa TaxID=172846 RepID=A0AAV4PSM7_CAEEX|nr:hypothetical protein CEXT_617641 [Caerostris extrusa]
MDIWMGDETDGWMDIWMGDETDGWMDIWMGDETDGWMDIWMGDETDGWMDIWMGDGWMDGHLDVMDGWTFGLSGELCHRSGDEQLPRSPEVFNRCRRGYLRKALLSPRHQTLPESGAHMR